MHIPTLYIECTHRVSSDAPEKTLLDIFQKISPAILPSDLKLLIGYESLQLVFWLTSDSAAIPQVAAIDTHTIPLVRDQKTLYKCSAGSDPGGAISSTCASSSEPQKLYRDGRTYN